MLSDLKLGMQLYEVQIIYKQNLTLISTESQQGYDLAQYRGWFSYDGKALYPYLLTFELYPWITKEQCQSYAAQNNITDPNKLSELYMIIALRPSKLIQIDLDENTLQQILIGKQNSSMNQISLNQQIYTTNPPPLKIDAYGPGVHMNQYGQPVKLRPDFGGVPGETLKIQPNAYGPGVHMDQYGRPVREYPWP